MRELDDLFREAEPYLIGLWKYRERGQSPQWYATVLVNGNYFDVEGAETITKTLAQVLREITREKATPETKWEDPIP